MRACFRTHYKMACIYFSIAKCNFKLLLHLPAISIDSMPSNKTRYYTQRVNIGSTHKQVCLFEVHTYNIYDPHLPKHAACAKGGNHNQIVYAMFKIQTSLMPYIAFLISWESAHATLPPSSTYVKLLLVVLVIASSKYTEIGFR